MDDDEGSDGDADFNFGGSSDKQTSDILLKPKPSRNDDTQDLSVLHDKTENTVQSNKRLSTFGNSWEKGSCLLVNAGVGRGKRKTPKSSAGGRRGEDVEMKGGISQEWESKLQTSVQQVESLQINTDSARCQQYEFSDDTDEEDWDDGVFMGGVSTKEFIKKQEVSHSSKGNISDNESNNLFQQLKESRPNLPESLLQRAIHMHSENAFSGYLGNNASQNRKWLKASLF